MTVAESIVRRGPSTAGFHHDAGVSCVFDVGTTRADASAS